MQTGEDTKQKSQKSTLVESYDIEGKVRTLFVSKAAVAC